MRNYQILLLSCFFLIATSFSSKMNVATNLFKLKQCITLDLAKQIAAAAAREAVANNWSVVCCILDDGGNVVYLEKMDGTQIGSIQVAQDKALTAVKFKRPTKVFEDMIASGKQNYLKMADCLPIEGGVPLFYKSELIGSIGISGVTSAQDGQIAAAGAARLAEISSSFN